MRGGTVTPDVELPQLAPLATDSVVIKALGIEASAFQAWAAVAANATLLQKFKVQPPRKPPCT